MAPDAAPDRGAAASLVDRPAAASANNGARCAFRTLGPRALLVALKRTATIPRPGGKAIIEAAIHKVEALLEDRTPEPPDVVDCRAGTAAGRLTDTGTQNRNAAPRICGCGGCRAIFCRPPTADFLSVRVRGARQNSRKSRLPRGGRLFSGQQICGFKKPDRCKTEVLPENLTIYY